MRPAALPNATLPTCPGRQPAAEDREAGSPRTPPWAAPTPAGTLPADTRVAGRVREPRAAVSGGVSGDERGAAGADGQRGRWDGSRGRAGALPEPGQCADPPVP